METSLAAGVFAALSIAALLVELVLGLQALRSAAPWSQPRLGRIVLSTGGVLGCSLLALIFALGTHHDELISDLGRRVAGAPAHHWPDREGLRQWLATCRTRSGSAAAVVLHDLYRIAYVQRLLLAELSREAASAATSAEARVRVVGLRRAKYCLGYRMGRRGSRGWAPDREALVVEGRDRDGKPLTQSAIEAALRFGCKREGLRTIGSHVLRHTFCSHLAMRGAAPKAIQELVGHSTLTMTLRYMHLAPSALTEAIDLLNLGQPVGIAESAAV